MLRFQNCRPRLSAIAWSLVVFAAGVGPGHAAAPANRFGIYDLDPPHITVGQDLGVAYQRWSMPINPPYNGAPATSNAIRDAGFAMVVTYNNICRRKLPPSCPVTDPSAYKAALATDLDLTHPTVVVIENEEDGTDFSTATPAQYLQELTYAVQAAHAKGYKVTNGGLTTLGLNLAYWHYLWLSGDCQAADTFAASAFYSAVVQNKFILGNIPTCQDPNRPILGANTALILKLQSAEFLIAGYQATGIDYVNFHWYQADAVTLSQSVAWLEQTTGLQAVAGEMGQFFPTADLIPTLLSEVITLNLPYVIWFASDGAAGAYGLADSDGTLRLNGLAFKSFVSLHK